jgi:phosphohistidine phosphatase
MKLLLLIRHAKSDWSVPGQEDFDRTLNEKGKKDAPVMAKWLAQKKVIPELIISSTANRAGTTALLMAKTWLYPEQRIIWKPELYHAGLSTFSEIITNTPDKVKSVALFSHNPGISLFANALTPDIIENIPTCGVVGVKADTNSWGNFMKAEKKLVIFEYPKMIS